MRLDDGVVVDDDDDDDDEDDDDDAALMNHSHRHTHTLDLASLSALLTHSFPPLLTNTYTTSTYITYLGPCHWYYIHRRG